MLDIAGKPMLQRVVERTARAKLVDQVVVATTSGADEDPIAQLCEKLGIACFRGSLQDVLDRYYQCAVQYSPDMVVRITADCPVIDPELIDETIGVMTGKSEGNGLWKPQGNPESYPAPTVTGDSLGLCCHPVTSTLDPDLPDRPGCGGIYICCIGKSMERSNSSTRT